MTRLEPEGENWWYGLEVPESFVKSIVPQGSIAIDGISLTVARWHNRIAEIAIIPYTYEHTNVRDKKIGSAVISKAMCWASMWSVILKRETEREFHLT